MVIFLEQDKNEEMIITSVGGGGGMNVCVFRDGYRKRGWGGSG